ncbi:hypothetical protein F5Y18DRAFT_435958 [Xylariaceae sp. FL1019]|nr:hypothetical protein F5Y18DRAFT_435958 [Xylariaceae sp. FL1019]
MHSASPHYPIPSHHSGPHIPLPPVTPNTTLATVTTSATSSHPSTVGTTTTSTSGSTTAPAGAALPTATSAAQDQQHAAKVAMIAGVGAGVVAAAAILFLVWFLLNRKTKHRNTIFDGKWLDESASSVKAESTSDASGSTPPDFPAELPATPLTITFRGPAELPATPLAPCFLTKPPRAKLPPPCLYKPLPSLPYDQRISHNAHLGALRATLAGSKIERSMDVFANSWADNVPYEFPDEES